MEHPLLEDLLLLLRRNRSPAIDHPILLHLLQMLSVLDHPLVLRNLLSCLGLIEIRCVHHLRYLLVHHHHTSHLLGRRHHIWWWARL